MLINGIVGFTMMLTLLFCIGKDVDSVLETATGYPFIQIFYSMCCNPGWVSLLTMSKTRSTRGLAQLSWAPWYWLLHGLVLSASPQRPAA